MSEPHAQKSKAARFVKGPGVLYGARQSVPTHSTWASS